MVLICIFVEEDYYGLSGGVEEELRVPKKP